MSKNTNQKAIAVFDHKLSGVVIFKQKDDYVKVDVNVKGLKKNKAHGFHIHQYGDLSDGCTTAGPHFNPFEKHHGGREDNHRHVGDLGNIISDDKGEAKFSFKDSIISLKNNKRNIIGRALIIHEGTDDCGRGGHDDSLTTGHAGGRLDCAVIGICK